MGETRDWLDSVVGREDSVDMEAQRRASSDLERFRCRDFGPLVRDLGTLMPEAKASSLYHLPLTSRVAKDAARHYILPPTRITSGLTDAQRAQLDGLLEAVGFDRLMLEAHQRSIPQQALLFTVLPGPVPGVPRIHTWTMAEADVELEDLSDSDVSRARRVVCWAPSSASADGTVIRGRWVFTDKLAYSEDHNGDRRGLWDPANPSDLTHPLGRLPVAGLRWSPATKGRWWPTVAEDLLSIQVGLVIAISDVLWIAKHQSHGQPVLTGPGAGMIADGLDLSPSKLWTFDSLRSGAEAGDVTFELVTTSPPIEKYLAAIETTLRFFARYNYLPIESVGLPSIVTGQAVRELSQAQREETDRQSSTLVAFEREMIRLLCDVASMDPHAIAEVMPPKTLRVQYHLPQPRDNALQAMQAKELEYSMGLGSAIEDVAIAEGVSVDEAKRRLEERLERHRAWLEEMKPEAPEGLDNNVPMGGFPDEADPIPAPDDAGLSVEDKAINPPSLSLNGAQVASMVEVARAVGAGELTEDAGVRIIAFAFGVDDTTAREMVRASGRPGA